LDWGREREREGQSEKKRPGETKKEQAKEGKRRREEAAYLCSSP
jgi:hypothetical protein